MTEKKIKQLIELNTDTILMVEQIVEKYKLKDNSKAFRVLLDYLMESRENWDLIFKKRRCKRC